MPPRIAVQSPEPPGDELFAGARPAIVKLIRRAVELALRDRAIDDAEISVTLLDDRAIAALNENYLGHEGPTDVLSFALHAGDEAPLGDIYIGHEQALRQAADLGVPPAEELVRLAVHGTLHVLGFDHPPGDDRDHGEMWSLQERILAEVIGR